mmetsp:Transcript_17461/g.37852  ORF Transcript_17461/g.37852 Transcript_17461/m.37852 type:complete len:379 (-) Transcript_17461:343-1479(-)
MTPFLPLNLISISLFALQSLLLRTAHAFHHGWAGPGLQCRSFRGRSSVIDSHLSPLWAKKKKTSSKAKGKAGGNSSGAGFGAAPANRNSGGGAVSASKASLEKQWESLVMITMCEMTPLEDTSDATYRHYETADVFVRGDGEDWFRIGKVVSADRKASISTSVTAQTDLILWTASRMYDRLKDTSTKEESLVVGYTMPPASDDQAFETDGPVGKKEAAYILRAEDTAVSAVANMKKITDKIGFRPDFVPPGFKFTNQAVQMDALQNMGEPADDGLLSQMFGSFVGNGLEGLEGGIPPGAEILSSNIPAGMSSGQQGGPAPPKDADKAAGQLMEAFDADDFDKFFTIMRETEGTDEGEARKTFDMLKELERLTSNEEED